MDNTTTILGSIDPEISERLVTRREAIRKGATLSTMAAAGLALGSVPVGLAALSREAFGQTLPADIKAVLDFALALEIFENEFYKAVLGTSAVTAQNTAFAPVRALLNAAPGPKRSIEQIQKHESQHVAFLQVAGATNVFNLTAASFDFTGNRSATGGGPFAAATTDLAFLLVVAQAAEDTGVRAYKGQAGALMARGDILESALRIHSVEARHAARIRRIRRLAITGTPSTVRFSGTISGGGAAAAGAGTVSTAVSAALEKIYGVGAAPATAPSEANTTHAGVDVTTLTGLPTGFNATTASEAFDEPLSRADVVAIVQPFFIPTIA